MWHTTRVIPDPIAVYFWDVDVAQLDLVKHKDYIIERLMGRGDLDAMRWLRRTFDQADLHEFVVRRGRERLAPRELAYWALICDVDMEQRTGGGRPHWAG